LISRAGPLRRRLRHMFESHHYAPSRSKAHSSADSRPSARLSAGDVTVTADLPAGGTWLAKCLSVFCFRLFRFVYSVCQLAKQPAYPPGRPPGAPPRFSLVVLTVQAVGLALSRWLTPAPAPAYVRKPSLRSVSLQGPLQRRSPPFCPALSRRRYRHRRPTSRRDLARKMSKCPF
jgi:hypothetical protein